MGSTALDRFVEVIVCRVARAARNCLYVLICCLGMVGHAMGEEPSSGAASLNGFANTNVTWQLKNVHATGPGKLTKSREGKLTREYVIEADADAGLHELFGKAHFRLSLDAFSPAKNMPGQLKGKWYVRGKWTLEPEEQTQGTSESMLTGPLSGRVKATLSFDPTAVKKAWKGKVRIPMTRVRADNGGVGVRPMRGEGEIGFISGNEGSLSVSLKLWPKLQ